MAQTGGLTRPAFAAANPVTLLRIALIAAALAIWQAVSVSGLLFRDVVPSLAAIARRECLAKRYVARVTKLAFIAPSIVEAIVEGRAPAALNLQMLMDNRVTLPLGWKDQERLLELQQ